MATLQNITGSTSKASPTLITRDGPETFVVVHNTDGGHVWVRLPSSCIAGDLVEVYYIELPLLDPSSDWGAGSVLLPPGEHFVSQFPTGVARAYRKLSSNVWS